MLDWMVWTKPVAIFFICILLILVAMSIWELKSPSVERKGFLPIATTRGDRLFIGLLGAAYINLAFVGLSEKIQVFLSLEAEPSIWIGFALSLVWLLGVMKRG